MCGRFTLKTPVVDWLTSLFPQHSEALRAIALEMSSANPSLCRPRYNIAPTQPIWVITQHDVQCAPIPVGDNANVRSMRWGLVPGWATSTSGGYSMINARIETLTEKPSFRSLLTQHRCIVVADGYYEWKKNDEAIEPAPSKIPHWIHRPADKPMAMAGLWTENRRIEPQKVLQSATIITTAANADTRDVHDRMPLLLQEAPAVQRWLSLEELDQPLEAYIDQAHAGYLVDKTVSTLVNNARNEGPDLLT